MLVCRTFKLFTTLALLTAASLYAQPEQPHIVAGNVEISALDTKSAEFTATDRSIVQWNTFSIAPDEALRIQLPHEKAAILNRVTGREASQLLGRLDSNGKVYLINPSGIVIGKEGVINTAAFLGSTLEISDTEFLNSDVWTFTGDAQEIVNLGTLQTSAGDLILIGKTVRNEGTLAATGGCVYLASGSSVSLKLKETPLISIQLDKETQNTIVNTGKLQALQENPYKAAINHDASTDALSLVEKEGSLFLICGHLDNQGSLQADTQINIEADGIINTGSLDASGLVVIQGSKMINAGNIVTSQTQGAILINLSGPYIETKAGHLSAPGGAITITAPRIFSSGKHNVDEPTGAAGTISLLAQEVVLPGAYLSAQGRENGTIKLGQTTEGQVHVNEFSTLRAGAVYDLSSGLMSGPTFTQAQLIDPNQGGGTGFGTIIVTLPSGNTVVTKPGDNLFAVGSGAVYLYETSTAALISTLTGSQTNDNVGSSGVTALTNGNYVVRSASWDNGAVLNAGAVTWGNGTSGIIGTVSSSNSLVGTALNDNVGSLIVIALTNGNYVVSSPNWDNGGISNAGAVTWGNGTSGIIGTVSSSNSLVGTSTNDQVGGNGLTTLTNGNYVVRSQLWNNGGIADAGAVTWGNGSSGISGTVSSSNSLVGTTANDQVGSSGITALTNGNYVVISQLWNNGGIADAGAVTWGNGSSGINGTVSSSNSLVGTTALDRVGFDGVTALTNGNYVVRSASWDNGGIVNAGAATWGNGSSGISGTVSSSNSLVGTTANDQVGFTGVTALTNGNYVVISTNWSNGGILIAGAVTWGDGTTGISGTVSSSNSLVGTTALDQVGGGVVRALTNGNYVVRSIFWDNGGIADAGAATWGNGSSGISGTVSSSNSLVGTSTTDQVGINGVTALSNGNFVVISPNWDNAGVVDAGAVTWGNGASGIIGTVSTSNSLVGTTASDRVGSIGVAFLANGNYVVLSPSWDNAGVVDAGAATWGNGSSGISGTVSSSNSLVGTSTTDQVGSFGVTPLTNGNYVVRSQLWDNGGISNAGAVTWGDGTTGVSGTVSSSNSLVGTTALDQVGSDAVKDFGLIYAVISSNWDNGGLTNAGAVSIGSSTSGLTGEVSALNSLVGETSSTDLTAGQVQFDTLDQIVVAGFRSESTSGRVRITPFSYAPTPPTPPSPPTPSVSTAKLSRGVYNFSRAIGNIYELWDVITFGSPLYQLPCSSLVLYEGWEFLEPCKNEPTIQQSKR